ncbi:MAG: sulfur carrier protein ThiS [Rhodomicrobium sp.]
MKIMVNGEACNTEARTIADLCRELGLSQAKVATAKNGEFVAAKARTEAVLVEGDVIEIVSPRQGG